MRIKIVWALVILLSGLTLFSYAVAEEKATPPKDDSLCNATCKTMQSIFLEKNVVRINLPGVSQGTGTIISHESVAYILTSNHEIERVASNRVEITFESGEKSEVEVLGRDPAADLAILSAPALPRGVTPAKLGYGLAIAQQVYALGYPFGERRITFGYISAIETQIWLFAWTQTPLDPGNSGGPLFNERMEVVGVNTAVISREFSTSGAISLVIPVDYVKRLLPRLLRERIVRHGVAGIIFTDSARIPLSFFKKYGLKYSPGSREVVVMDIQAGSSTEEANIRKGDVILKWNDTPVMGARKLMEKIFFDHSPGDEVTLTVRRGEQTFKRSVRLMEYAPPKQEVEPQ